MKKPEIRKLQLQKDTLRRLEGAALEQVLGADPTTTVLTRHQSCTCY